MKNNIHGALKFIGGGDPTSVSKFVIDVPAGRYSGFLVYLSGTNDTGDDWEFSDAENAIFRLNNDDMVNLPLGFLADYTNLEHGTPGNSSTTAGAISQAAIVPLQAKGHQNAILVRTNDVASLTIDLGTSTADIASGNLEVYAIESDVPTNYLPRFYDMAIAIGSGQTRRTIESANLIQLYMNPVSTNLDNVRVEIDHVTEYDASDGAATVMANIENQVESALTYINTVVAKNSLEEGLGAKVEVIFSGSGSDTVNTYVFAFGADSARYSDSIASIQSTLERKATKSSNAGNSDTVAVIRNTQKKQTVIRPKRIPTR